MQGVYNTGNVTEIDDLHGGKDERVSDGALVFYVFVNCCAKVTVPSFSKRVTAWTQLFVLTAIN